MMYSKNDPVFTEKDAVKAKNILKAILIRMCIEKNITYDDLHQRYKKYATSAGYKPIQIYSGWNNLIRAITTKDSITYSMFEDVIRNVLCFNLSNVSMTMNDENNETYVVSIDRITF